MMSPEPVTADLTIGSKLTPEILCQRYADKVYRFATMVTGVHEDVEDVAQDALEHAVRRVHQFDPRRGTPDSWLWRIVVNASADAGRRRLRRQALWTRFKEQQVVEATTTDVESEAIQQLSDQELLAEVRRLPLRDRTIIALRFGADLDIKAVATSVGISQGAAAAALHRALTRLRLQLEERA